MIDGRVRAAATWLAELEEASVRIRCVAPPSEVDDWLALARREDAAWQEWTKTVPVPGPGPLRGYRDVYEALAAGTALADFRSRVPTPDSLAADLVALSVATRSR